MQAAFERGKTAIRLRKLGLTFKEIGRCFGVRSDRARQIYCKYIRYENQPSPFEQWAKIEAANLHSKEVAAPILRSINAIVWEKDAQKNHA